jgi:nucleoside-diphosphate-sugar epimerase
LTKEVLITGGTGMMGRHLDIFLTQKNISVDITTSLENEVSTQDGIYSVDITDADSVDRVIHCGYKAIFNMAGVADPRLLR